MVELHLIYAVLYAAVAVLTTAAASVVWQHRAARGARPIAVFMLGVAIWAAADAAMWYVPTLGQQVFWERAESLGSWIVPVAFLALAFEIAGIGRWLRPSRIGLIAIVSFALSNLEWLNPGRLYDEAFVAHRIGPYTHYAVAPGPLYWLFVAFAYGLVVIALVIIFRVYLRSSYRARTQAAMIFIGGSVPLLASAVTEIRPVPLDVDLAPLAFFVTGALWLIAILRGTLLEVLPLARDTLIEQMLDGVVIVDGEGVVADANPTALTMLGATRGRVVGKPAQEVFGRIEGATAALRDSAPRRILQMGRDGDSRHAELSVTPLDVGPGAPPAQLLTFHDVTQERRAQEQSARLAAIVTSSQDAIFTNDLDGVVTSWNAAAESLLGYSAHEMIGKDLAVLMAPGREDRPRQTIERMRGGEQVAGLESPLRRKDGSLVELAVTLSPILDDAGDVVGVSFIGHDITERKRAERELRDRERDLARSQAVAHLGSWNWDIPHDRMTWSDETYRIYGVDPAEFGGTMGSVMEVIHPDDRALGHDVLAAVLRGEDVEAFSNRIRRPDGEERVVMVQGATVERDDAGAPVRFFGVVQDITEQEKQRTTLVDSEASLRESKENLEQMIYAVTEAMGKVVEARDPYTQGHEVRVAALAGQIAREMCLSANEIEGIQMAGLVHDIGKLRVPAEVLTKPGRLTDLEYRLIKEHSQSGWEILKDIDFPWPLAEMVLAHHERCDGSGYPKGLSGHDIIQGARVLAVADVVEAMASHRPYRPALGTAAAVAELAEHREKYDPDVVRAFMALYESGQIDFQEHARG